jgi:hypothetical protein
MDRCLPALGAARRVDRRGGQGMSGFHYHESQALNQLLDAAPQKVLRQISIRAGITVAGA